MKKIFPVILVLIPLAVLSSPKDNSLVYGELLAPNTLWPYFTEDPVTLRMIDLYLRPLVYNFSDAYKAPRDYIEVLVKRITPEAINWSRTPNLKLELRDGLKWSSGRKLTADDVIETFYLLSSGEVNTIYKFVYDVIYNITTDSGKKMLNIDFSYPSKSLLSALNFFILPKELAKDPEKYNHLINDTDEITKWCNGPYVPSKIVKSKGEYVFKRNENAPDPPYISYVKLRVNPDTNALIDELLTGKIDMIVDIPPSIVTAQIAQKESKGERVQRVTAIHYSENRFYFIMLNYRNEIFHDEEFRRKLIRALNRENLSYALGLATEWISGPLVPGSVWSNPSVKPWEYSPEVDLSKYNPQKAFVFIHPAFEEYRKLAAGIITQWRKAGLTNIRRKEYKPQQFWKKLEEGDFDMALFEFKAAKSFVTLYPLIACDGSLNYAKYNCPETYMNTEINKLLEKVEGVEAFSISAEKRLEYYQILHKLLHDTEPHIWLFTVQRSIFYNSALEIPFISPSRPFKNVEMWSWK